MSMNNQSDVYRDPCQLFEHWSWLNFLTQFQSIESIQTIDLIMFFLFEIVMHCCLDHVHNPKSLRILLDRKRWLLLLPVSHEFSVPCLVKSSCCPEQCWKFLSPGRPRRSGLGLGDLLSQVGSPGGRSEWPYLSFYEAYRPLWPLNLQCKGSFGAIRSITFWIFQAITPRNCHFVSLRALYLYSGLPGFQVRSPAGLPPDYNEFPTLAPSQSYYSIVIMPS